MQKMNEKLKKSRWLHVVSIFAVCVVVLSIAALMISCGGNAITPDGPEVGVYYYELVDGEALLTLSSGNNFTLVGPVESKTGTYTVNENEIVLDFLKDEDGTASATLSGDTLVLTQNDATMTFTKKVNYTVSFEANGGSSVASVTVVNGKTVAQPQDPTKDGSVFVGWYTDASFTTLYDFASGVVKANTTLYARWADKVVGQSEYTVSFDLGYASAETMADKVTAGGKLYNVAAPERTDYVFGGWYISMYEDGEKLTYAYTEDTVFEANTTLYAVWYEKDSAKLQSPAVSVSGNTIKWELINGASTYQIKIYDANGTVIYEGNEGSNSFTYDFGARAAGDYKIEVTAVHSNTSKNSDVAVRYFKNKALPRVSGFQVIDNVLVYNAVAGAEKYLITVDCGNSEHTHTLFDNGTSTSFNFANCSMQEGGIVFTVTAVANGRASSVSEEFVFDRSLPAIGGIVYDKENDVFVWDTVNGATSYVVTVVAGGKTYVIDNNNSNSFSVANYTGEISLSVVPVTAGYNSPAAINASCVKTAPQTPAGVTVSGLNVTWSAVEGATSYEVKLGSQVFTVTENSFSLNREDITLNKNEVYSVQVKAIKNNESSAYSEAVNVNYYAMGTTLVYKNNTVFWTPVAGVTTFEVRVNGGEAITVTGVNSARVTLTQAGVNTVEVRCPELDGTDWVSVEVVAYAVTYMSRTLGGEVTEYLAVGDTLSIPEHFTQTGYTLTGWYNTPGAANGNGKPYTSTVFSGNGDVVLYANWTPNDYNIKFVVDSTITNVVTDSTHTVTYTKDYQLTVPVTSDNSRGYFVGWFDGPAGSGTQLTDAEGNAVAPYGYARDCVAYPFFETGILSYDILKDGTYGVKKGVNISNGINIKIPTEYKGIAVTTILDNGFYNCDNIVKVEIPDTITRVGAGAFDGCDGITEFNVYKAKEGETYETFYSSFGGALIYFDAASSRTYLEIFPIAKTGTYTMPDDVEAIRGLAFRNSKINKVIIGKGVTNIAANAFYSTDIETIEFAEGGTAPLTIETNGFRNLRKLTTLKLPARLTTIGNIKDFDSFTSLTNLSVEAGGTIYSSKNNMLCDGLGTTILYVPVTFKGVFEPQVGITGIGPAVFANNPRVTEVIIPAYVTNISAEAFKGCAALTKVTINGGRTSVLNIGESAFDGSSINDLIFEGATTLDAGAVVLGKNSFANCVKLDTVDVKAGANIASIGYGAFSGCTAIEALSFDANAQVSAIGDSAFSGCVGLLEFTLHKTTASVGSYAFSGCDHLATFAFAEGGSAIAFGGYVFDGCIRLQTVKITKSVPAFDSTVFNGCATIKEIVVDPANTNFKSDKGVLYNGDFTEILFYPKALEADIDTIKALRWDTVTKIGGSVFSGNSKLTEMYIGPNVTVIGEHAFDSCLQLTKISFANNTAEGAALSIGAYAFNGCSQLAEVPVPAYTNEIGAYAFYGSGLKTFTIPAGVTTINEYTFSKTKLQTITIPTAVTAIKDGAFTSTSTLTELVFAPVTEGAGADLVIGSADARSSNGVFYGTKLTSVTLPDRVTYVGAYAFYKVTTLTTLTVSDTSRLAEIGAYAFEGTSKLATVSLGKTLRTVGTNAFKSSAITAVTIPASVKDIGDYAFSASKLASVTFEEGTEELYIGNYAFNAASFTTVNLPARTAGIGKVNTYGVIDIATVFSTKITSITVTDGGKTYAAKDGVVYGVDESGALVTLIYCPQGKTGDLVIPKTVTLVESNAFNGTKLTTVEFEEYDEEDVEHYGKGLLKIGTCVHSSRGSSYPVFKSSTLKTIKLPSHLKEIGQYAIYGVVSTNIEDPSLSDGIIWCNPAAQPIILGRNAISNNSRMKEIHLPAIAELAGTHNLYNNTYVSTLTIAPGSTYTLIPASAFANMELTTFTVPKSVTKLGNYAFSGNPLTSIVWEDGCQVEEIGMQAFARSAFETFDIPNGVKYLGNNVWQYSTTLKTINIPVDFDATAVSSYTPFADIATLEAINVDPLNSDLCSVDGVLFDKEQTILFAYPLAKEGDSYSVPEGVLKIRSKAFYKYAGKVVSLPSTLEVIEEAAFRMSNLESVMIPANVTTLGKQAFGTCSSLATLEFARGSVLRTIGERGFESCDSLTNVVLPDSLMEVGNYVFSNCSKLKSVVISASLTSISNYAFYSCSALESVTFQEGTVKIGQYSFAYCSSIKKLEIPASVEELVDYAFESCSGIESVEFAKGSKLTKIGGGIFNSNTSLKSIELPDSVTSMIHGVFYGCTSLKSAKLPAGITIVPENTFTECASLEEVILPADFTSIDTRAFENCKSLKSVTIDKDVTIIGMNAFNGCEALEEVIFEEGCKLVAIGDYAFAGTKALSGIEIPNGVKSISNYAFQNSGITTLKLPENLVIIGESSFENCANLTSANLPMGVTNVGARAFAGCKNLVSADLSPVVEVIGASAYDGCEKLTAIYLPASLRVLEGNPFTNCTGVSSFSMDPSNDNFIYSNGVLLDASGYTLIYYSAANTAETYVFPETVNEIGEGAFSGSKLKSIVVPDGITEIYRGTFANSKNLETVVLPLRLMVIGMEAFRGCSALESIEIPESVMEIRDAAFADCTSLTEVDFGERTGYMYFGYNVYENCAAIRDVSKVIPANATEFGYYMFKGAGIVDLVIPANITNLAIRGVFSDCKNLRSVTFHENVGAQIGGEFFMNCTALTSVVLPDCVMALGSGRRPMPFVGSTFQGCTALESVSVGPSFSQMLFSTFENCTALTTFTVRGLNARSSIMLADRAFANCVMLTSTEFIPNVTMYGIETFANCASLTGSITINSNVSEIPDGTFKGCTGITELHVGPIYRLTTETFAGLAEGTKIYFDANTLEELLERYGNEWYETTKNYYEYHFAATSSGGRR